MQRRFDPARSQSFDDPKRDAWQKPDQVLSVLNLKPGMKVADIGAGTGYLTVRLARHASAPKVFAVDIEPKMLEHIQGRAAKDGLSNVITVQASAKSPNLPEPVDLVILVNTYHHVPARAEYFAGLLQSLMPEGKVAIIDWKPEASGGPPKHFRFTARQIQMEMAKAGFRVLEEHEFLPNQTFQVFGAIPKMRENAGKVWDEMYKRPDAPLRTVPTPALPDAVKGLRPGKALDFGMGLGRNALYLAELGWDVTGVDLSEEAIRQVGDIAKKKQLRLDAIQADLRQWDLGKEKWDLIVAANMHSLLVESAQRVMDALKPGGLLVVEGYHADVREAENFKVRVVIPPGHPTNALPKMFDSLRVLYYQDTLAVADRQKGLPRSYSRVQLVAYKEPARKSD
jgi:cyclopropane fatty-acyl-phospholipid synthase-like methyltransferase